MERLQRIELLKKLVKVQKEKDDKHTYAVRWRDSDIHPVIIKVDTSFLRYRLVSGRTRRKQIKYLEDNPNSPRDLFNDPEFNKAQEAQHQILLKMIDEEGLRKDLLNEGQRQPAIITYDGYVLNGNRRLAALIGEAKQFVDCVVLPEDASPKDLYELELDLQMAKETKAEYNWVDELLHIRYGIETLEEKEVVVAKKMRASTQQIRHKLNMLYLVDLYLEWLKRAEHYYIVEGDEQVFIEMAKFIKKVKYPEKQKIIREEVFAILKNPPSEGRLYNYVTKLFKHHEKVQEKIIDNLKETGQIEKVKKQEKVSEKQKTKTADPIEALAETGVDEGITTGSLFATNETAKENVSSLIDAILDAEAEDHERRDQKAAFNAIREAQRKLQGVTINSNTLELESIYSKLKEIVRIVNDLIRVTEKYRN